MSDFEVRLFFSGMIALVPSPTEVAALFLHIPDGHQSGGLTLPEHAPRFLTLRGKSVGGTSSKIFAMEHEQVSFEWIGGQSMEHPNFRSAVSNTDFPRNSDEATDFSWVIRLSDLLSRNASIKPRLLDDDPRDISGKSLIAARITVGEGEFGTSLLAEHYGQLAEFELRARNAVATQERRAVAIAEVVSAVLPSPKGATGLRVRRKPFDSNQEDMFIDLAPKEGDPVIEALLLNGPPNSPPPKPGMEDLIGHFTAYYDLLDVPVDTKDRILPYASIRKDITSRQVTNIQPALRPSLPGWRPRYWPENPRACPVTVVDPPQGE